MFNFYEISHQMTKSCNFADEITVLEWLENREFGRICFEPSTITPPNICKL